MRSFSRQLVRKIAERLLARLDKRELPFDQRDRRADDLRPFVVGRIARPLIAQSSAGLFGLGELDEFLEREAEQVAQSDQALQANDVRLAVEAMRALAPPGSRTQQPELLVVADRARRHADLFGHLTDPERALLHMRGHATSASMASRTAWSTGRFSSTWWYLPPRSSDATAATRQATIAKPKA